MLRSFMRRFTYCHVASPASGSTQSGPTQTKRCRVSLPTPNAAAACSGVSYFFPIRFRSYGTPLAPRAAGGPHMTEKWNRSDDDERVTGSADEEVRGVASDEDEEFDEDAEDLDEEEEDEESTT